MADPPFNICNLMCEAHPLLSHQLSSHYPVTVVKLVVVEAPSMLRPSLLLQYQPPHHMDRQGRALRARKLPELDPVTRHTTTAGRLRTRCGRMARWKRSKCIHKPTRNGTTLFRRGTRRQRTMGWTWRLTRSKTTWIHRVSGPSVHRESEPHIRSSHPSETAFTTQFDPSSGGFYVGSSTRGLKYTQTLRPRCFKRGTSIASRV